MTTALAPWRAPRADGVHGLGFSIYSDEPWTLGSVFRVEIFLAGHEPVACVARVSWIESLRGPEASFDVGFDILEVEGDGLTLVLAAFMPPDDTLRPAASHGRY